MGRRTVLTLGGVVAASLGGCSLLPGDGDETTDATVDGPALQVEPVLPEGTGGVVMNLDDADPSYDLKVTRVTKDGTIEDISDAVDWSSTNEAVASVSETGTVRYGTKEPRR